MSKYTGPEQHQVFDDIESMTYDELEAEYGIKIRDNDDSVWDPMERRRFDTLREWAQFLVDSEDESNFAHDIKRGGKWKYDDDRW